MDELLRAAEEGALRNGKFPDVRPGDLIRVHERLSEGREREGRAERIQVFEGLVLKKSGSGTSKMFTVRKISSGIGVEKTFPLHSPKIVKIEVVKEGRVRQARPYYLRRRRDVRRG
ncbi:MAG: 50S ribosomal protein L19 [Candidatus Bipolaricaulia bacterium]